MEAVFFSRFAEKLSFMGGTAIHIVHGNTRFSEDFDFDNLGLDKNLFEQLAELIQKRLKLEGYAVEIKNSFEKTYHSYISFTDILSESSLSKHKEEKLLIQLDTEPQRFRYQPEKVIINKFDIISRINIVPIDVLLAQKIYAIIMRRRPLGRDFYDAIFLFGKTKPNLDYLKLKIGIENIPDLKTRILQKCSTLDFRQLAKEVEQFLFVPSDAEKVLLFYEYIQKL